MFENLPAHFRPPGTRNLPDETRATCSSCVMAAENYPKDSRDPGPFHQELKCCTYAPFLPNFTLGQLLARDPAVLTKANLQGQLTPLGLIPEAPNALGLFGQDHASKCAFVEKGRCSIWSERPSVCRTYFCVSDRGEKGQAQWRKAEAEGNEAEWRLAHEVAWDMGFTQDELETEIGPKMWAEWADRKHEFFLQCAQRAFDPLRFAP